MIMSLGNLGVLLTFLPALLFVIFYHAGTKGQWRHNVFGRHLMAFTAAIAATSGLGTVRAVTDASFDEGWFAWLRLVVYWAIPLLLWQRLWLLWRVQIRNRRRERGNASTRRAS